eukprot:g4372.t1
MTSIERKKTVEQRVGFLSLWSYTFLNEVVDKAREKYLTHEDLLPLGDDDRSEHVQKRFSKIWNDLNPQNSDGSEMEGRVAGYGVLLKAFYFCMPCMWIMSACLEIVTRALLFATPFLLKLTIEHIVEAKDDNEDNWIRGFGLCSVMGFAITLSGVTENRMQTILASISMKMQAIIQGQVFRKYFRLSPSSLCEADMGLVLNLVGEDTQRIFQLLPIINFLWSAPLQMIVAMGLLIPLVGPIPALGATAVLVLTLATMKFTNDLTQTLEHRRAKLADRRIRFLSELLQGIKVVKLYAWEIAMTRAVDKIRSKELRRILEIFLLRCSNVSMFNLAPVIMNLAVFLLYVARGHSLDAATVFSTVALINLVRAPLILLPILQSSYNSSVVSFQRIARYLHLHERCSHDDDATASSDQTKTPVVLPQNEAFVWPKKNVDDSDNVSSSVDSTEMCSGEEQKMCDDDDASSSAAIVPCTAAHRESDSDTTTLEMVSVRTGKVAMKKASTKGTFRLHVPLTVRSGELIQFVGSVGSGKTAILRALLGEMECVNGAPSRARLEGKVGFVPQTPWLSNATVRDNILFGKTFDAERYAKILWLSALEADIAQFANGDMVSVGENGVTLSGGQKARIQLARALYSDADVYLLDDCLSAVDGHVAAHIFFTVIHHYLRDKTVLLATHQVQFLSYASRVVALDDCGQLKGAGAYKELSKDGTIESYPQVSLETWLKDPSHSLDFETHTRKKQLESADVKKREEGISTSSEDIAARKVEEDTDEEEGGGHGADMDESKGADVESATKSNAPAASTQPRGGVPWKVHVSYFRAAGSLWSIALLGVFYIVTQISVLGTEYVLAAWTGDLFDKSEGFYLALYGLASLASTLAIFVRLVWFVIAAWRASSTIHQRSVETMLAGSMGYFSNTPAGATIALFSRDQGMIDTYLSELYNVEATLLVMFFVSLVVVGVLLPWCFLAFLPLIAVAYRIQSLALPAVGNVQMLNLMSLGPVFSYFSESMSGLSVIRSAGMSKARIREIDSRIDRLNNAYYHAQVTTKWLDVRMDVCSGIIVVACSAMVVVFHEELDVVLSSLLLGYIIASGTFLGFIVQVRAFLEMMITGVERCDLFHKNTPQEHLDARKHKDGKRETRGHADEGTIELQNVDFRYRDLTALGRTKPAKPLVLRGLTATVPKGRRVAVIGRT